MMADAERSKSPRNRQVQGSNERVFPLQLHTLSIGMRTILLVPLLSAAVLVVGRRTDVEMGPLFGLVFVGVAVSAGLATLLPYERLFRTRWGMPVVFTWSVVNLALIAIGIWATGGSDSPLVFLYALTTLFFAVAFTPRTQVVFFVISVASYWAALGASRLNPVNLAVLGVLAFLANLLVGQLKSQTVAHREARLESERRWALLAVVSAAARDMSAVEPVVVLRAVVDSVVALGFPTTRIYVQEDGHDRAILPSGVPEAPPHGIDSLRFEAVERVLSGRQPVVVGIVGDAREPLQKLGLSSLVVIPIPVEDRAEAILVVGIEEHRGPSPQDVEVFQMLTTQAAVALENARRFERQRASMERIAELDRMKSDFLSNISHELRTPLTVIAGVGRTLELSSSILSEDERRDLLARSNANAATLDGMLTRLLDFGRLEAGQLEVEPVDVALRGLVDGVTDRLASLFRDHTVHLDVEEGLTANADPLLIERVVENLLTNAAKYAPPGSRVQISAISEGREAIVAVEDDGPGIPPDELCHIGERFFRGGHSNTRSTRGTGLGLAVVSEILDLHGTYLEVESKLGIGSRFSFRLPRGCGAASGRPIRGETVISASALHESAQPLVVSDIGLPGRFETVLAAAQMGLEWPVAALCREFHPKVLRYLRAHLPDRAEELASETWSDIASALPTFEGNETSFRRWVFAAARRRLLEAREGSGSARSTMKSEQDDDVSFERRAVDAALARISTLAPQQADVLLLRALGDLDAAEVAEIRGDPLDLWHVTEVEGLKPLKDQADPDDALALDRAGLGMER
jgi:signal transduction histidine kinase/DNA-directed RNA polymerase specialized sigma24 family protein